MQPGRVGREGGYSLRAGFDSRALHERIEPPSAGGDEGMSMYNLVHGQNPLASMVPFLLEQPESYFGRFRDAWVEGREDGSVVLAVYTRNGGGNREHYDDEKEAGPDCDCTGCIGSYRLPEHPLYIEDRDDDYDCTYATFYFRVPEGGEARVLAAAKEAGAAIPEGWSLRDVAQVPPDMQAKWESAIAAIGASK